jgi:hypothetical protein
MIETVAHSKTSIHWTMRNWWKMMRHCVMGTLAYQACLLRQSGLLGSCMAAALGQRKAHVLLLRTGMLVDICTASLCLFVETIGNAGEHVGRSNAAPSNGSKTLTTPRQVPFISSLVFSVPYLSQWHPLIETWLSSSLCYMETLPQGIRRRF